MRIAIGFFGLIRSLRHTHTSIKDNLLKILEDNGHMYDIYIHTYDLKVLTNKRTHEKDVILDVNDYKLLNPKDIIIDDQEEFDKSFNFSEIMKYGDAWKACNDNFSSLKNLIRQLNSLKKLTLLISKKPKYDMYIYIRPDLKIVTPFDINWLNLKNKQLATPAYFKHMGGLNDRFVIGTFDNIKIYGSRIDEIYNFCKSKKKPLHSEQLVRYVMEKNGIKNIDLDITLIRVRGNGNEAKQDYTLK